MLNRILRESMFGIDVTEWQWFLLGMYPSEHLEISYRFDSETTRLTKRFQQEHGVFVDGVVTRQTLMSAMEFGFGCMNEPTVINDTRDINWPQCPTMSVHTTLDNSSRCIKFGQISYNHVPTLENPYACEVVATLEPHVTEVVVPQLAHLAEGGKVIFNKLYVGNLLALFKAWEDNDLLDLILTFDEAYSSRLIRGSRRILSNHAFGTAFDINGAWNPVGRHGPIVGDKGSVRELVQLAYVNGFCWGGHLHNNVFCGTQPDKNPMDEYYRIDPKHFEISMVAAPVQS